MSSWSGSNFNYEEAKKAKRLKRVHNHYFSFFEARDEANLKLFEKAVASADKGKINTWQQLRSSARKVFNSPKCPPGKDLFLWIRYDQDDQDPKRWERVPVTQHKSDPWAEHGENEKVYDEYSDEWDLCSDMGKGFSEVRKCVLPDSDADDDDDELPYDKKSQKKPQSPTRSFALIFVIRSG